MTNRSPVAAPAPVPATTKADQNNEYQPRDPVFFVQAASLLAASLVPPSGEASDVQRAETTALLCARILDGGPAPEKLLSLRHFRLWNERAHYDFVQTSRANKDAGTWARPRPIATVAEEERARAELALREKTLGPLPWPDQRGVDPILEDNAAFMQSLRDISEPVRAAALSAAALRLAQRPDISGATVDDAARIVIDEIDRARRFAEGYGVNVRSVETERSAGRPIGPNDLAWPASTAAEVAAAGLAALAGELDDEPAELAAPQVQPSSVSPDSTLA
jgi:hypothetical protein